MQKIRINDLARELEVKSKMILDALIKVGVTEKKTHSSSIEVDEAERVKKYFAEHAEPGTSRTSSRASADEFKPKLDLSHISKPGDVLKAITQRAAQPSAVARPAMPPTLATPAGHDKPSRRLQPFAPPHLRLRNLSLRWRVPRQPLLRSHPSQRLASLRLSRSRGRQPPSLSHRSRR